MDKSEFISHLSENYSEGCLIACDVIFPREAPDTPNRPLKASFSFGTLEQTIEFFSDQFDESMVRNDGGVALLSCSVIPAGGSNQ
jgi:hypothetical protein